MKMLSKLLQKWVAGVLARPRLVLALALATAVASVVIAAGKLDVQTDQLELISSHHPLIALTDKLEPYNFGGKTTFTVVVQAPAPEQAVSFAKNLSQRIQEGPKYFQDVLYRVDPNLVKPWALLYPDKEEIQLIGDSIQDNLPLIQGLAKDPDLVNFVTLVNQEMASRMVGELFTGFLDDAAGKGPAAGKEPIDLGFLIQTLDGLSISLEGSDSYRSPWFAFFKNSFWDVSQEGYFWEGGKQYLLMFVTPQKNGDGFNGPQDSLQQLRKLIQQTCLVFPEVQAGVTGQEALNNDEMTTAMGDMTRATWLSLLGIMALMVVFLYGLRRPLIEIASLAVGLCWTLGWTTLVIGHLNILSVVFAPLLCGLGVDYGIHWFARYEEHERGASLDPRAVIQWVANRSGPGIFLAGLSAAFSFLPLVLTGFRGLMELGLITGFGILFIVLADFTVLPALSIYLAGRYAPKPLPGFSERNRDMVSLKPRSAYLIVIGTGVLCLLSVWGASKVNFDLNPLRLQTANAESVVWEQRLMESSRRSLLSAAAFASSPEEVSAKSKAFEALHTVSTVESIFTLLPQDQGEKIPLLRALLTEIPQLQPESTENRPLEVKALLDVLERIRFKTQADQARAEGADPKLVEQMTKVHALTGKIIDSLRNSPDAVTYLERYREHFRRDLADTWAFLRDGAAASPMGIQDVPRTLRDWFYHDGQYLIRIYPKENIWEEGALTRFVKDLQNVDAKVVGDPISLYVFASAFKRACIKASIYALVAIFVLLWVTFRRLSLSLLAFVPLIVGSIWTVGIMGLVGVDFNLANSMFMPLIVGAGVEYGVIILHRWGEGCILPGHLPFSTGKGVVLAALTTTIGFGTLMLSHHRGIFSLGFVAWTGSICVLVAAVVLLPAMLVGIAPPKAAPGEELLVSCDIS
jgi:hopanoid biosynthesis associated RND transporter like protein HpnN